MRLAERMANRIHLTCVNFDQRCKLIDDHLVHAYDKCLKGHDLERTNAKKCEDYELEYSPFCWGVPIIDYEDGDPDENL